VRSAFLLFLIVLAGCNHALPLADAAVDLEAQQGDGALDLAAHNAHQVMAAKGTSIAALRAQAGRLRCSPATSPGSSAHS
jgi:hypothetical protein